MTIFSEPKIDSHVHVFDPVNFPYVPDAFYVPTGGETGTPAHFTRLMDLYNIRHALLVEPNSGYNFDNRCMLDAIADSAGRFKGIAVVPADISYDALVGLKQQGIIGIAFNVALYNSEYYADSAALLEKIEALDLFAQIQVINDQLIELRPLLRSFKGKILIDHCGRPDPAGGVHQAGFRELLELAPTDRASVKISGQYKISGTGYPYPDMTEFIAALLREFTLDRCVWASDWPFLRAPERLDLGPLLSLVERYLPEPEDRHKLFWETPARLFGFA